MKNVCEFMLETIGSVVDTPDGDAARTESTPAFAGDAGPAQYNFVTDWYMAEADCKAGHYPITSDSKPTVAGCRRPLR